MCFQANLVDMKEVCQSEVNNALTKRLPESSSMQIDIPKCILLISSSQICNAGFYLTNLLFTNDTPVSTFIPEFDLFLIVY